MRKALTPINRLKRAVEAIERGVFELVECEAVAVKGEPGRYTVTVLLERLVEVDAPRRTRPPRQSAVRELIFDEE